MRRCYVHCREISCFGPFFFFYHIISVDVVVVVKEVCGAFFLEF